MTLNKSTDLRVDQLRLLKLERRGFRSLTQVLLDSKVKKGAKLAVVASVTAMLIAFQSTPGALAPKLQMSEDCVIAASSSLKAATSECDFLTSLVEVDASTDSIVSSLGRLFSIIDEEHARFEKLAKGVGARLIQTDEPPLPDGGTGDKTSVSWLIKFAALGASGSSR